MAFLSSCAAYRSASALSISTCLRNYLANGTGFISILPEVQGSEKSIPNTVELIYILYAYYSVLERTCLGLYCLSVCTVFCNSSVYLLIYLSHLLKAMTILPKYTYYPDNILKPLLLWGQIFFFFVLHLFPPPWKPSPFLFQNNTYIS